MSEPSLSARPTSTLRVDSPTPPSDSFPLIARPIPAKPHFYLIDGLEYGPESVFSYAQRLKGNPYRRAKAYAWAEAVSKGQSVCELGDHYITYATAEVHHRIRKNYHIAKTLGIACQSHNASHGDPRFLSTGSTSQSEKRESMGASPPEASSLESAKHDPQRAAWDRIIADGSVFKELERQGLMTENSKFGSLFLAQDLAEIAVSMTVDPVFGKYSSETFARYAREDRFDKLEMIKDAGRWWVKPRI
jgi:hypothetical protein